MTNKVLQKLVKKNGPFVKLVKLILSERLTKKITDRIYKRPAEEGFLTINDPMAQKPFQMFWRNDFHVERSIYQHGLYGHWEKESLKIWAQLSKKAKVIIDIGANTGVYSLIAKNNNPDAKVIAVEPVDINYNFLLNNINRNHFDIPIEKIALSDKEDKGSMFMLKDKLNYMTSFNDNRYSLHPEVQENTEVVEIDVFSKPYSYIHEKHSLQALDLVKIDVEGHETAVINGMIAFIEKYKPDLLIEIIVNENAQLLDNLFKPMGYHYVSIPEEKESVEVDKLWDNGHCNFLICKPETISYLKSLNLVKP